MLQCIMWSYYGCVLVTSHIQEWSWADLITWPTTLCATSFLFVFTFSLCFLSTVVSVWFIPLYLINLLLAVSLFCVSSFTLCHRVNTASFCSAASSFSMLVFITPASLSSCVCVVCVCISNRVHFWTSILTMSTAPLLRIYYKFISYWEAAFLLSFTLFFGFHQV